METKGEIMKKLSVEKQVYIVRDKLLEMMQDVKDDVEVPNFIYGAMFTVTELAYDTAPNSNQAQLLIMNSIMAHIENRENIELGVQKKRGKK